MINAFYRHCPCHPNVAIVSPDGAHSAPCFVCEAEHYEATAPADGNADLAANPHVAEFLGCMVQGEV